MTTLTLLKLEHFSIEINQDNIAIVTLDVPNQSMNVLDRRSMNEIEQILEQVDADPSIKGVVLMSGKTDSFIAGADIEMLDACQNVEEGQQLAAMGQTIFNQIENAKIPYVAAIHGICLGGGLEFSLACHYRLCTPDEKTQFGLPEVKIGLLPGSGGTQRLPRTINLQTALDMMLTGKQLRAKQAFKYGLVDAIVPLSILLTTACQLIAKGKPIHREIKRNALARIIERSSFGRGIIFDQAIKAADKVTQGNYPAPGKIIQVVREGLENGKKAGLALEAQLFGELTQSKQSQQLRNLFFAVTEHKKDQQVVKAKPLNKALVLGGGLMGGGIAYVTAIKAGIPTRIKDINEQGICRALKYSFDILKPKVKRRFLTQRQLEKHMANLTATTQYDGVKSVDVVIEAVFEDLALKQTMLADIEAHCSSDTIFATNTSSLPITEIAANAARPENVIGLHFFSPVDKMPLVEVIVHDKTSQKTIDQTLALARLQGKTPILVKDGAGFYVNRILALYMNEALNLVLAGEPIDKIDRALIKFGFPVGPIKLLDEVGIDIGAKIAPILTTELGERFSPPNLFNKVLASDRKGKKNKKGFYQYEVTWQDKLKRIKSGKCVDPEIYILLGLNPVATKSGEELVEPCVIQMLNEAVRCLEEGVITSPRDGDLGAIFGIGFPPFLGGPFRYIDSLGADYLVSLLNSYQARFSDNGERFKPCDLLVEMATQERLFYPTEVKSDKGSANFINDNTEPQISV